MLESATTDAADPSLTTGMYVRVPLEERPDNEYREYCTGRIVQVDPMAATVAVDIIVSTANWQPLRNEYPRVSARRCHLLPASPAKQISTRRIGTILTACQASITPNEVAEYYVQFDGMVERIPESDLLVASTRQDPDPWDQLASYELHNPVWHSQRDEVVECYARLRNATYGLEDLVGSRVILMAHQAEVIARVLSDTVCRYVLADEVGLGKTIEASVILKALQRRHPEMNTLIVVPSSLTRQWHNELDSKFWMDFDILVGSPSGPDNPPSSTPGFESLRSQCAIVSAEDLSADGPIWDHVKRESWGLLIVDEAHHLHKNPQLYDRVLALSTSAERVLVLSATPIQRRAEEFLALLRLLDPGRYRDYPPARFEALLAAQEVIRKTIAYLMPVLTLEQLDVDEFVEEFEAVIATLSHDKVLPPLVAQVAAERNNKQRSLVAARDVMAYVSENYRIENRVIRNRRASLQIDLPQRELDPGFAYMPSEVETETLETLYDYLDLHREQAGTHALYSEFARVLLHAAFSSPHALLSLLNLRSSALSQESPQSDMPITELLTPAAPRNECGRIERLLSVFPAFQGERNALSALLMRADTWRGSTEQALEAACASRFIGSPNAPHRLVQACRAIYMQLDADPATKCVVFTAWKPTLEVLQRFLVRSYGRDIVSLFHSELDPLQLQSAADLFQASPSCAVLLCDELGGEGRNFQIADSIIHVDIPWTPAQVEQRIGRVDRLGRLGLVPSIVPYARRTLEYWLYSIWNKAFELFTSSMSGMEIALEGVQDDIAEALAKNVRQGIEALLPNMIRRAAQIKADVKEERHFEEGAINYKRRAEFKETSDKYADGTLLRDSFRNWATLAGLRHSYDSSTDILTFIPEYFSQASMEKAKLYTQNLPNMEVALRRSGRARAREIRGTFNRAIASRREDIVFFAPGSDAWTDAILANAFENYRGRCCAIQRADNTLDRDWLGFELLYSLSVDPRPLYEAALDPVNLYRAQGYLAVPTYRIIISIDKRVESLGNQIHQATAIPFIKGKDRHLGQRDAKDEPLRRFKEQYPNDYWLPFIRDIKQIAEETLDEELDFMPDVAQEAEEEFAKQLSGRRASRLWIEQQGGKTNTQGEIQNQERVFQALTDGIRNPVRRLESICFWHLTGKGA